MVEYTARFPIVVGALLRRQIRSALDAAKLAFDLRIEWVETKSLLESEFFIKATGSEANVRRFLAQVQRWEEEA